MPVVVALVVVTGAMAAACSTEPADDRAATPSAPASTASSGGTGCAVTRPVTRDRLPPAIKAMPGTDFYGSGDLWVDAWFAGQNGKAATRHGLAAVKWGTFTVHNGRLSEHGGPPDVKAERLDGPGAASASFAGVGYARTSTDDGRSIGFWPTVVEFPHEGCWHVTETHGTDSIRFILYVAVPSS